MRKIIIAIDGHSSCGKSTLAKQIAKKFNYKYIDTGAMYRAVTLFALKKKYITTLGINEKELIKQLKNCNISFEYNSRSKQNETYLNNKCVENEIREIEVANHVSDISSIKEVRQFLVKQQQKLGENKGIVMDGRDIGTVVFPEAELKIFMTATAEIRAKRRYDEMIEKGQKVEFNEILKNVKERDYKDSNRKESPLRKADDAIILDNSAMNKGEQLDWIIKKAELIISKVP